MAEYQQLYSIYSANGKNYAVNLQAWGNRALTGSDLTQFQNDMSAVYQDLQPYLTAGNIVLINITETITTVDSNSLTIPVGLTVTRSPDLPQHPILEYWSQRMQADPNITVYNPEIRIS